MVQVLKKPDFSQKETQEPEIKVKNENIKFPNQLEIIFNPPKEINKNNTRKHTIKILKSWKNRIDYYYTHLDEFPSGFKG
jgi:hypothetical protein